MLKGIDAYDPEAWQALRARYGSTWMPNPRAPYPIWTAWLMVPFAALDLDWTAACCLVLMTQLGSRKLNGLESGLLVLGAFLLRGTMTSLINGQFTLVLLAALTSFLVLYVHRQPLWAGRVLCGIAFKPSSLLLCMPSTILALAHRRAWRVLAGTAAGGAILLSAGGLLEPGWLARWLSVQGKTEATFLTPTV